MYGFYLCKGLSKHAGNVWRSSTIKVCFFMKYFPVSTPCLKNDKPLIKHCKTFCSFKTYLIYTVRPLSTSSTWLVSLKDVRAHCYCASLVRTLYMTWHVPRHVFEARALSRNSTKYRADGLCGNLICEYFCWMLGDPHFFFGRSLSFLILSIILKNKKNLYVGSFNYFSCTIQIGSSWYMDTSVRDLDVACFKANST